MRVWQWVKNLLVFAPIVFASKIFDLVLLRNVVFAFFSICFAASFVYVVNDIFDIESDKVHPQKRNRPLARGDISIRGAYLLSVGLIFLSTVLSYFAKPALILFIAIYVISNLFYSKYLKHKAVIDILFVSSFYLFRVYIGGFVAGVYLSGWLLLTTFFVSLFLITGKRRAELVTAGNKEGIYSRKVLNDYNEKFLDSAIIISLTLSILFYSLYSIFVHDRVFAFSILFVVFCALRYLYLIFARDKGEEPEKIIFTDRQLLLAGFLLAVFIFANIYLHLSSYIHL